MTRAGKLSLGDSAGAESPGFVDPLCRGLGLPHDWMIEGPPGNNQSEMEATFDPKSTGGAGNGYLHGGVGGYRKSFAIRAQDQGKHIAIEFGDVYINSHVCINGDDLGVHPYGYQV